ncbi:MAG TPA: alpha/beta fold hydrolase [Solirubrobacteraceae bacterium]|nr:alpha/beta fold hydrolase [Solirubrobacteraceae bacterium]
MQPSARTLAAALVAALVLGGAAARQPALASAQIAYEACAEGGDFACGHLTVPLDPSGASAGTVTLALMRRRAPVGGARSAIVALAGGPGQPALPFTEVFEQLLGPIAATRDLIVFDQRGIGLSQPLACHAFEQPSLYRSFGALIAACAGQLGPDRAFYTSADTVADLEAIRVAGGYEKLVLYGTSYGTKVAEEYAQRYPGHVEALVLDSVVPPAGPETLERPTFAAIPRIMRQLCAARLCAGITAEPVAALARVVKRMARAPLRGRAIDGHGTAHTVSMDSEELVEALLAGDFSPLLRSSFVTAVAAAAQGDDAPLARLLGPSAGGEDEGEGEEDFDNPLYFATTCEEQDFPWSRAAEPSERLAQAAAAARSLGARAFAPFTATDALALSDVAACAHWPYATPAAPSADAALPNVPTLILSGADDLRTPTSGAREVARAIPDAHLLVVPFTGHSVLTEEPTSCASDALRALFAGRPIEPCRAAPVPAALRPPPLPPRELAKLAAVRGYGALAGRTLHAVALTLRDLVRQILLTLTTGEASPGSGGSTLGVGGLRAGWATLTSDSIVLHGYSYVPGVTVSGTIAAGSERLSVGGFAGAHGTLRGATGKTLLGTLAGRPVALPASALATAAIVEDDAQESTPTAARGSAARRAARLLGELFGGRHT